MPKTLSREDVEFNARVSRWVLAVGVTHVRTLLSLGSRSAVYDWLHGARPRGYLRAAILRHLEAWEAEQGHVAASSSS